MSTLRRKASVTAFVATILLIVAAAVFGTLGVINHFSERSRRQAELRKDAVMLANQLSISMVLPVWNFDWSQVTKIAEGAMEDREIYGVIVRVRDVSAPGGLITRGRVRDAQWRPIRLDIDFPEAGSLVEQREIVSPSGDSLGTVKVYVTPRFMELELAQGRWYMVALFLIVGGVLTASLYVLLWRTVLRPLSVVEQYAGAVAAGKEGVWAIGRRPFRGELERLRVSIQTMVESLRRSERQIESQLRFEGLVSRVSSLLAGAVPENLEEVVRQSLKEISATLDADRVNLCQTNDRGDLMPRSHFVRAGPPVPVGVATSDCYPYLWERVKTGELLNVADVSSLPASAVTDIGTFNQVGTRSLIAVPVFGEEVVKYVLSVASVGKRAEWGAEVVSRLRIVAEVLSNAILRCEAERERGQAEAALRLTQYAVDHNPMMIYRVSMEGRLLYANEAACEQLGYSAAELLRMHVWDMAVTATRENWMERAGGIREEGIAQFESAYVRKNGEQFPVEVRTYYMKFSGEESFFTFAFDISARKSAEQAVQAHLRRIQKLAKELTHSEERQRRELAAILHDGVGQNLFAATTQLVALRSKVNGAEQSVEKVLALLDQVTRDTRELTFELCPPVLYEMGLGSALERLCDQFGRRYGIACTFEGTGVGPRDLNARGLAYQTMRELLTNAAKHSGAKHVALKLYEREGWVALELKDDGKGFEPGKVAAGKGGFGLFHLRERVELLGGSVRIESSPGAGTRVEVRLPAETAQLVED